VRSLERGREGVNQIGGSEGDEARGQTGDGESAASFGYCTGRLGFLHFRRGEVVLHR